MYMFNMSWHYNRPSELADEMGDCITISNMYIFKCLIPMGNPIKIRSVVMNCRVGRCPNLNVFLW